MDLTFDDFRTQYHEVFKNALVDYNIDILEEKYKSFNLPDRDLKTPLDQETIAELDNASDEKKCNIDFNLYCKFWALQDYFRNPNQCYNKVQWKAFSSHATNVLSAFSSCKLEDLQRKRTKPDEHHAFSFPDDQYFAKFLTSQKLLELQLSDGNFRRCILVQFLILFQYLNSTVKFKSDNYELKPDQIEWVRKMTDLVYSLLEETPPDGDEFAKIVRNMLLREEHWNSWKNDGCPEFRKPKPVQEIPEEGGDKRKMLKPRKPKKYLGDILKEAAVQKKYNLGNPELTKLWNLCPDNLEACKAKERDFLPQLDSYFSEAIEQLDPEAMVDDEYKKINDGNFGWRAIRLIARRSPQFFGYSNNPIAKQSEYLEMMIKRVAKVKQDNNEVDEESKAEDDQSMKQPADATIPVNVTMAEFENLISSLGEDWKTLALKLGFSQEEIKFFETSYSTPGKRAVHTLRLWFEDEGASIETFCDICDDIGHSEITETIKTQYINTIPVEFTKRDSSLEIDNNASNPAPDSMDSIDFN
ncbi:Hpr1 [Carabus blaptoides fortunei]